MNIIKDYMQNDTWRHALNALTEETFGFNFESWVTNGYYEGDYIPYSYEENGKNISNVSANIMNFEQNGKNKNYIQIGTVMTDINHRNKGLAKELMEHVLNEYEKKCDGIYLFGDLSAVEFYKKMGFKEMKQYVYILKDDVRAHLLNQASESVRVGGFEPVDATDFKFKEKYMDYVRNSASNGAFEQKNKYGLQMFYTADLEDVYYSKELDCFLVMEQNDNMIELHSILSKNVIPLEKILAGIITDCTELKLGFTPRREDAHLFVCTPYDGGDDYRLFCYGEQLESIETEKLYFPTYSHA